MDFLLRLALLVGVAWVTAHTTALERRAGTDSTTSGWSSVVVDDGADAPVIPDRGAGGRGQPHLESLVGLDLWSATILTATVTLVAPVGMVSVTVRLSKSKVPCAVTPTVLAVTTQDGRSPRKGGP